MTRITHALLAGLFSLLTIVVVPSTAGAQTAPPTYDVTLLARPLGFQSVPFDLNDDGDSVGYYLDFSLNYRAIAWDDAGTPTDLAAGGTWSQAHGIASDGTIGGFYGQTLQSSEAALHDGNGWDFLPLRRRYSGGDVDAVNGNGWAVGSALHTRTRSHRPVLWRNGRMRVLASSGAVFDINDDRVSVGWTSVNGFSQATAWDRTTLLHLDADQSSSARAISSNGIVIGYTREPVTNIARPTVWSDLNASPVWLDKFDGLAGSSNDVNADRLVVGNSRLDPYNLTGEALLWLADGSVHDLNTLIDPASGWTLNSAVAINDNGQILGFGTCTCASGQSAFLLTPR